jgi:hypothetical protein
MVKPLSVFGNISIQHTIWPLRYIKTCPILEVPQQQDVDADQMVTIGVVVTTQVVRDPVCNTSGV